MTLLDVLDWSFSDSLVHRFSAPRKGLNSDTEVMAVEECQKEALVLHVTPTNNL